MCQNLQFAEKNNCEIIFRLLQGELQLEGVT